MTSTNTKTIERTNPVSKSKPTRTANRPAKSSPRSCKSPTQTVMAVSSLARKTTKRDQLAALLVRDEGATLNQMIAATGWLPHTTRAAMTGLRKAGFAIASDKIDGVRNYRAVAPK